MVAVENTNKVHSPYRLYALLLLSLARPGFATSLVQSTLSLTRGHEPPFGARRFRAPPPGRQRIKVWIQPPRSATLCFQSVLPAPTAGAKNSWPRWSPAIA
jgi:hypothetical protein